MSFLASVGVTNVDLMYVGMPRVPQEGEEIFSQDFRVLLGGGTPGTAVNAARLGILILFLRISMAFLIPEGIK